MTVDSGQAYQAFWAIARFTTVCCLVLLFSNLSLLGALWTLLPLKKIQPMLVTFKDQANQVVKIEPIEQTTPGWNFIMEAQAREYVELRETLDFHTESHRWQKVYWLSSPEVYEPFEQSMDPKKNHSAYTQFKERGVMRTVRILGVTHLAPLSPNVWQIEWESLDRDQTGQVTTGHWVSTLTAECREREMTLSDRHLNPAGFTVIHYTVRLKAPSTPTRSPL